MVVKQVFPSGHGHRTAGLLCRVVLGMLHFPGHDVGVAASCFSIFIWAAPVTALHVTLSVTSVRFPVQSVIFLPFSKNAIIFLPSRIRNCLLVLTLPLAPFTTNLSPSSQPFADFVSRAHRSIY